MSADNTIAIVKSPNYKTGLTEYRVNHVQAIENIHEQPDIGGFNSKWLKHLFGDCQVYTSELEAIKEAHLIEKKILEDGFPIEYGIRTIEIGVPFPE